MEQAHDKLSQREEDTLRLASQGLTDKAIAAELGVQLSTVRTYWDRLKVKLSAANRTEAVARSIVRITPGSAHEEVLENIGDAFPHLLAVADSKGRLEFVNTTWQNYFGPEASGDVQWARFVHPADMPLLASLWGHLHRDHSSNRCRIRYRRQDGTYRWHLAYLTPVRFRDVGARWLKTAIDLHELGLSLSVESGAEQVENS